MSVTQLAETHTQQKQEKQDQKLAFDLSSFTKWRPKFHLLAPHNWLNDPCGPGYDPCTKTYHLAFQWNPKANDWADISWGHATSFDLLTWDTSSTPCLVPSAPYDNKGIFTGCFQPTNLSGETDGTLTYFYTSVNKLPIHYTLPYSPGCETLSIAISRNHGRTWERYIQNPILPGPPQHLNVSGWRDPYLFSWPNAPGTIRRAHSQGEENGEVLYGLISGGVVNRTPTAFVYAIQKNALAEWKYLGILLDVGLNFAPSRWSGDLGVNFEVTNLVTLSDGEGVFRDFVLTGVEGCLDTRDTRDTQDRNGDGCKARTPRSQAWICITENEKDQTSSALMQYSYSGFFDTGLFYAANSFWDPVAQDQVVFGWVTEEDLPDELRQSQGWSGLISLPRVVKLQTIRRVKGARVSALRDITSIEAVPDAFGTYTVRTLGVGFDERVKKLRTVAEERRLADVLLETLSSREMHSLSSQRKENFLPLSTTRWELDAEIAVGKHCARVGVVIYHDSDNKAKTVLSWTPTTETFQVDRPDILCPDGNTHTLGCETSPHTLFTYTQVQDDSDLAETEAEVEEPLHIHVLFDTSVLEIFVNGRTAITTRVYHEDRDAGPACVGVGFFAETLDGPGQGDGDGAARLFQATVWDGLGCL